MPCTESKVIGKIIVFLCFLCSPLILLRKTKERYYRGTLHAILHGAVMPFQFHHTGPETFDTNYRPIGLQFIENQIRATLMGLISIPTD